MQLTISILSQVASNSVRMKPHPPPCVPSAAHKPATDSGESCTHAAASMLSPQLQDPSLPPDTVILDIEVQDLNGTLFLLFILFISFYYYIY